MRRHARLQQIHQFRLHEFVIVGDVQANDFLLRNVFRKFVLQTAKMFLLHYKNEIGPGEMAGGNPDSRTGFGAGGTGLDSVHPIKDFFGGETAPTVSAADEQDFQRYFSFFSNTLELRPLLSYFSRRPGGKSSGVPSMKPPLD